MRFLEQMVAALTLLYVTVLTGAEFRLKEIDQLMKEVILWHTVKDAALADLANETPRDQTANVVTQGGVGYPQSFLDLSNRRASMTDLDQISKDRKPRGIAQFSQALCGILGVHILIIIQGETGVNHIFRNIEIMCRDQFLP